MAENRELVGKCLNGNEEFPTQGSQVPSVYSATCGMQHKAKQIPKLPIQSTNSKIMITYDFFFSALVSIISWIWVESGEWSVLVLGSLIVRWLYNAMRYWIYYFITTFVAILLFYASCMWQVRFGNDKKNDWSL